MNDFTKKELMILNLSLRVNHAWYAPTGSVVLMHKIQSMIDNYSEPNKSMIVEKIKYLNEEITKLDSALKEMLDD